MHRNGLDRQALFAVGFIPRPARGGGGVVIWASLTGCPTDKYAVVIWSYLSYKQIGRRTRPARGGGRRYSRIASLDAPPLYP